MATKRKVRRKKKTGNTVRVNFKGVDAVVLLPEGPMPCKVGLVTKEETQNGDEMLKWTWITQSDNKKYNDKKLFDNSVLIPKCLWVLRQTLETLGVEVPDGPLDIDLDALVGLEAMIDVVHEKYQGTTRAKVNQVLPLSDEEDDEDEDDEDLEIEDDEDEDDEDDEDDEEEDDEDDEDEDDEEDDEDEEEGLTEDEVMEMSKSDLLELVKEHSLRLRQPSKKPLSKLRTAVVAAMEKKNLLD